MRLACTFYDAHLAQKEIENEKGGMSSLKYDSQRLSSLKDWQVMNEVALHRGGSPHLNTIDIFVDGQHLTEAVVRLVSLRIATVLRSNSPMA